MKYTLLLLVIFVLSVSIKAQSLYIPEGHNGTKVSFNYGHSEDVKTYGVGFGYTPNGLINFSAGVSKSNFESGDLSSNNISGTMSYMFLKNSKERILGVRGSVGIRYSKYDGAFVQEEDVELNKIDYVFGAMFSFSINVFNYFEFIPLAQIKYMERQVNATNPEESNQSKTKKFYATTGAEIVVDVGESYKIIISPSITFVEGHTSYSLSFAANLQDI